MFLHKEKALYTTLNKLKKGDKLFTGYAWIPKSDMPNLLREIDQIKQTNRNVEVPNFNLVTEHQIKPPSLFRGNEFTWVFQEIVNTYGTPSYKEVNPAVFACVTFPFLFGVMFGDLGHGSVLLVVGIIMCLSKDFVLTRNPGLAGMFAIRYLILLMGFFAAFCGLIYNDFMAIPIWASWGSCYDIVKHKGADNHTHEEAILKPDCVYPIGVDPIWVISSNELAFANSYSN